MTTRSILLYLLLAPTTAHASSSVPKWEYTLPSETTGNGRIDSVGELLGALADHPTDDETRGDIGDFLHGLGPIQCQRAMQEVRENELVLSFLDAVLQDEEGNSVADEIYLAALDLVESGEHDRYAGTLATTPLNVYDPNEPGRSGLHKYMPDEFGGTLEFNRNTLGSRASVGDALSWELAVAQGCQDGASDSEVCGVPQGPGRDPADPPVVERTHLDRARLAMLAGHRTAAVEFLLADLDENPSDPTPLLLLGDLAREGKHTDLAIRYFSLALLLEPGLVEAAVWVSRSLADAERMAEALKTLDRALFVKPKSVSLLLSKGHLHLEQEDPEGALTHLQEAARLAPTSFAAHRLLGLSWLKLHRWAEAEQAYQAALSVRDDPQVRVELAQVYLESGADPKQALDPPQYASNGLAPQPDFISAVLNRGIAYGRLGQCAEAHRNLDPLIENGGDVGALAAEMLGECRFPLGG
jgi:tetratricopeptide (TPR) repeat protein